MILIKHCFLLIIIPFLSVSASGHSQGITLSKKDVPLIEVFSELRKQSNYDFAFTEKQLSNTHKVTVSVKNASINEVLEICFKGQPLAYSIKNNTITIKKKDPSLFEKVVSRFSAIIITGTVSDEQGNFLSGATVTLKGSKTTTKTDNKGFFSLNSDNDRGTLIISYLGYITEKVDFSSNNVGTFKVILKQQTSGLEEVEINAGYYTVKDKERTGSISRVSSETISKQPVNNVLMAIQNRITGLEITQLTGVPGGGFKVQIRGRNSVSNGSEPLYIIDGVTYPSSRINTGNSTTITQDLSPLSLLNPNDIESIEVLKDADATAIYGSQGANGVILITTKRGSNGEILISTNYSQGFSKVGHRLDLMDTKEYIAMRMEAFKNDGLSPTATDYDVNGVWDNEKYTDWQEVFIGGTAKTTNGYLNISGGNMNNNYLLSGNYYREGTVFPGDFGLRRGGIHTALNFQSPNSRLKATFVSSYYNSIIKLSSTEPTININKAPNAPDALDQYGELKWSYNEVPLASNPYTSLLNTIDFKTDNVIGNVNLIYQILNELNFNTSLGYNLVRGEELAKSPNEGRNPATNPTTENRESQFGNTSNSSWILEPKLSYNRILKFGNINALIGMSFQRNTAQRRNIRASNFNSDELMGNIQSASVFNILESTNTEYKYTAFFTRINFIVYDKYFLNLTARRDGSSRFGSGKQFANFGAIGGSWIFSDENFVHDNLGFLNFGKIRASYGITGNDQISDYGYMQLYNSSASYQGIPSSYINRIANPDYSWETTHKAEIALQFGFFKDRIILQLAHYRNKSTNQLVSSPLPPSVGAASIRANLPATVLNTGWEIEGTINILNVGNWEWNTTLNMSAPKNKLISYPGLNSNLYIIGQALNFQRYYYTTVNAQTGLYNVRDFDSNGLRNDADFYLNTAFGKTLYGGFQNHIRFKQLTFDFLVSFTKQTGSSFLSGISFPPGYVGGTFIQNQPRSMLGRWTTPGDQTDIPKYSTTNTGRTNFNLGKQDGTQSISDASFVRLKNVSLSYNIPKNWLLKLKLKELQINIQGQNLFTLTDYLGLDPEVQGVRLPPLQTCSIGFKIIL